MRRCGLTCAGVAVIAFGQDRCIRIDTRLHHPALPLATRRTIAQAIPRDVSHVCKQRIAELLAATVCCGCQHEPHSPLRSGATNRLRRRPAARQTVHTMPRLQHATYLVPAHTVSGQTSADSGTAPSSSSNQCGWRVCFIRDRASPGALTPSNGIAAVGKEIKQHDAPVDRMHCWQRALSSYPPPCSQLPSRPHESVRRSRRARPLGRFPGRSAPLLTLHCCPVFYPPRHRPRSAGQHVRGPPSPLSARHQSLPMRCSSPTTVCVHGTSTTRMRALSMGKCQRGGVVQRRRYVLWCTRRLYI